MIPAAASPSDRLHAGIAEHGKLCALRRDHVGALMHYREAMAMAIRLQAPEIVVRHYLECALESLEQMGAYSELIEYCDRAIAHYREHPPQNRLAHADLATIHQRRGVVRLKQGDRGRAAESLSEACAVAEAAGVTLPFADLLRRWIGSALTITPNRLAAEEVRHHYRSVRPETVTPSRAIPLPGHPSVAAATLTAVRGGL